MIIIIMIIITTIQAGCAEEPAQPPRPGAMPGTNSDTWRRTKYIESYLGVCVYMFVYVCIDVSYA